ncbi:MAG: ribonuclease HII [Firmicutes bacterium]|nr:ribonuclease HII [Bacillota bacterium]
MIKPQKIAEIKEYLASVPAGELLKELEPFKSDTRKGVMDIVAKCERRYEAYLLELKRLSEMGVFERKLREDGFQLLAGVDEAGRGPLAGPVCAGAVILPKDCAILGLNDSKKLSAAKREALFEEIKEKAIAFSADMVPAEVIDEINILQATFLAMRNAIKALSVRPDALLVDALTIPEVAIFQQGIIKGDAKSVSIAAGSIIAKVTRDRYMDEMDSEFPQYGFIKHKGYGSALHISALKEHGPCILHRKTFIKGIVGAPGVSNELGKLGEKIAESHLERRGIKIWAKNFRTARGEIDIIARDGKELVFCEVKLRSSKNFGEPREAVDERKKELLKEAAAKYITEMNWDGPLRFDAIEIVPKGGEYAVEHIKNAFGA